MPVPPGPSSIENDAHGIEKLLLKTQVSLTDFLQSEMKILHIIVRNNTYNTYHTTSEIMKFMNIQIGHSICVVLIDSLHYARTCSIYLSFSQKLFDAMCIIFNA